MGIRVSPEEEETGVDVGETGMDAYPEFTEIIQRPSHILYLRLTRIFFNFYIVLIIC